MSKPEPASRKALQACMRAFSLALILSGALTARAQDKELLHKTFAQRSFLLNDFYHLYLVDEHDSVKIFKRIEAIRKLGLENGDDDLVLETGMMRAHYFYYRKFPVTRVLPMLDSLRDEGRKKNAVWLEAMAENMSALYNFNHRQHYELGFEHHQRVYNLIRNLSPEVFPQKQDCLFQMADEHYFFNDFREAIFYNLMALKAKPVRILREFPMQPTILNTLGLCYQKLGELDSADYYFREVLALAKKEKLEQWEGIASGNLGFNFYLEKDFDRAFPLLEKDVRVAEKYGDWPLASGSQVPLAMICLERGELSKAAAEVNRAKTYVARSGQYQRLQYLYPLLAKWYAVTGNAKLAAAYIDSSFFVKDSLNRKLNALQMLRARQKVDLERHRNELESIEAQKTINTLQRNVLFAAVIFLMAGSVWVYREQRRKVRRTGKELEDASRQLSDFAKNISEKNALINLLEQEHEGGHSEALSQIQQRNILTDADWAHFKGLFEKVHGGYLQRLKEKLPGLTPAETRFMALSKLGLSTREMAAMLGVGTDTIRQHRSRLRRKLGLNEEGELSELAAQI